MKKYLFCSVLAIATVLTGAVVLTSCSHDDVTYSEENVQQAKHAEALAQYQQSFIGIFGQPASNQCWDFTLANSHKTRGTDSGSKTLADRPQESYNVHGYTWKDEVGNTDFNESIINSIYHNGWAGLVADINATDPKAWNPEGTYKFRLAGAEINKPGGKYYTLGADFGNSNNYILRQIKTNGNTSGVTGDQHTSAIDFDIVGQSTPIWFTVATSNKDSKITSSSKTFSDFVEVEKEYKGKIYTFWGFKVDDSYADIVLIVDKIEAATNYYAKRYFVEDLGGVGSSDIDFNDIVFDVIENTDKTQECIVRALGGTIGIKITVCGTSWSKPAPIIANMINTGADGNAIDPGMVIARFTVTGWDPTKNDQVSVEVENKDGFKFITEFPQNGEIPLMVAFSIAKPWKAERQPITPAWMSEEGEPAEED